ncbi:TolB family protein [Rubrobacter indicoceani]|uniref:TolB family protein n=1 Tax=Rubrobacter indicoceani TaxID=2051957 RepID=UPI0013C4B850|nr:hypothetical protein [Rubrobacter indicoceani]
MKSSLTSAFVFAFVFAFALRVRLALIASAGFLLVGCAASEGVPLQPLPTGSGGTELRLGADVRAVSEGPGYKSSPAWSTNGERLSYVVDGYVVARPAAGASGGREPSARTEADFGAQAALWETDGDLGVFGRADEESGGVFEGVRTMTLYNVPEAGEPTETAGGIISFARLSPVVQTGGVLERYLVAKRRGRESELSVLQGSQTPDTYRQTIPGVVTSVSISPDETKAVLAVRTSEAGETSEYQIKIFDLVTGSHTDLLALEPGSYIAGSPQWSSRGIHYLAGDETRESSNSAPEMTTGTSATTQRLFIVRNGPDGPYGQPAPGPGSGFTASNLQLSPDGQELALIGRLRSDSPTNVYVLDLRDSSLRPLTENEDMEMKNGPNDLSWSPDGRYLAIVARGVSPTGLKVYPAPASALLEAFYNVYRVPTEA